jgi:hypothetical protein
MSPIVPAVPPTSALQIPVTKFVAALGTPDRLLKLAPKSVGHPKYAAALSPAIVLTTVSAFEGFAEDFLAAVMVLQGYGFAKIAREVGNWNNPTLKDWSSRISNLCSAPVAQAISAGPSKKIAVHHQTASGNWSAIGKVWADVLDDAEAWMQVRHALTHGLVSGWRTEVWASPLQKPPNAPPAAATVLKPFSGGRSSLERAGAKSCARIYALGAQHVADVVAADSGVILDWKGLPSF